MNGYLIWGVGAIGVFMLSVQPVVGIALLVICVLLMLGYSKVEDSVR